MKSILDFGIHNSVLDAQGIQRLPMIRNSILVPLSDGFMRAIKVTGNTNLGSNLASELLNTLRAAAFQTLKVNLTNWVHWPKLKLRVKFFLLTKCSGLVIERMLASDDRAMPVGMSR